MEAVVEREERQTHLLSCTYRSHRAFSRARQKRVTDAEASNSYDNQGRAECIINQRLIFLETSLFESQCPGPLHVAQLGGSMALSPEEFPGQKRQRVLATSQLAEQLSRLRLTWDHLSASRFVEKASLGRQVRNFGLSCQLGASGTK
jgi:hypothetical protein